MAEEQDSVAEVEAVTQDAIDKATSDVTEAFSGVADGDLEAVLPLVHQYLVPAVSAVLVLIVGYMISKLLARLCSAPVRSRVDETLGRFVQKLVFYAVMAFTVLGVLGMFGISVASFAALIAAAGFAVGLAFQGTLSNFAAGVLLMVFRPFKIGDYVSVAGADGVISEIDLFTTTFNTLDNRKIIVPNSEITGAKIENLTANPHRRVDVDVGVSYSADLKATREALTKAAESMDTHIVQGKDRGVQIYLCELGDSSVNWQVRVWAKPDVYWDVREALTAAVKDGLDAVNIEIPFPQMDVHLDGPIS